MEIILKKLSNPIVILLIISILEAIIILILLVRNRRGRRKPVDKREPDQPEYWEGENVIFGGMGQSLNRGMRSQSGPQNSPIKQNTERKVNAATTTAATTTTTTEEHSHQSYNTHEEYAKAEREKKNKVQQIINDDGTVTSQIDFDLSNEETTPVVAPPKYDFLEAANGGQFRKLLPSDEKSFFRTWEENGIRKFEFHGNVDKALANINAIFDDVCEIEGKQNGATQISNVEPGILDSQLKVEKKAKIKLT